MSPRHRNLANLILQLPRDKQNLRVETPALDRLQTKDHLSCFPTKSLEPALRVLERKSHDRARNPIETATKELTVQRLMNCLPCPLEPARTDGNISAILDGHDQPLGLL